MMNIGKYSTRTQILVISGIIVLVLCIMTITGVIGGNKSPQKKTTPTGTVLLAFNTTNTSNVTVSFNQKNATYYSSTLNSQTYKLAPGTYTVLVTNPGYSNFTAKFSLQVNQQIILNARSTLESNPSITSISQIPMPGVSTSGVSIRSVNYFDDRIWAVVAIQGSNTGPGVVVVEYNPANDSWQNVVGPGTSFEESNLQGLPEDVQQYLLNSNYINTGAN